jgi:predicted metal-dependent hydrolase
VSQGRGVVNSVRSAGLQTGVSPKQWSCQLSPTLDFRLWTLDFRLVGVSRKSAKIAAAIENLQGEGLDAHYLGYFECFNRQLFYEAHDVLETIWLAQRKGQNDSFYKGLIQLAGAFVHLQKNRLRPAGALFKLAQTNLMKYPATYERLRVAHVLSLIAHWLAALEANAFTSNPLSAANAPKLSLEASSDAAQT